MTSPGQQFSIGSINSGGGVAIGSGNIINTHGQPTTVAPAARSHSRLLLLVVTRAEEEAAIQAITAVSGATPTERFTSAQTVVSLGMIRRTEVLLARAAQGAQRPNSAGPATPALIEAVGPDYLVLIGICYGLRGLAPHGDQWYGDVLVADQVHLAAHHKKAETVTERGGTVHPSAMLLDRFLHTSRTWPGSSRVHFGSMVSESVLVNDAAYCDSLRERFPEAIGGEMEAAGVYPFAARAKVEWGMVKAICDFGQGKTDEYHRVAADNAAEFITRTVTSGALDPALPAEGKA